MLHIRLWVMKKKWRFRRWSLVEQARLFFCLQVSQVIWKDSIFFPERCTIFLSSIFIIFFFWNVKFMFIIWDRNAIVAWFHLPFLSNRTSWYSFFSLFPTLVSTVFFLNFNIYTIIISMKIKINMILHWFFITFIIFFLFLIVTSTLLSSWWVSKSTWSSFNFSSFLSFSCFFSILTSTLMSSWWNSKDLNSSIE